MAVLILSLTASVVTMILSAYSAHVARTPERALQLRELAVRMAWCTGGFLGAIIIAAAIGAMR